jgi:hypothetical protein
MWKLAYVLNFFILIGLFSFSDANLNANQAASKQNEPELSVVGECKVGFDPNTNEIQLLSPITVSGQSRNRCIIRVSSSQERGQVRLVPVVFKGEVKKAPATVAISSVLIGDTPTSVSETYTDPTKFDLTDRILETNSTSTGKNVFGINLVLITEDGELEITDMKFALQ